MSDVAGHTPRPFPLVPLLGGGGIMAISILAALVGVLTGAGSVRPVADVVSERSLQFEDRADGSVAVRNVADGQIVGVAEPGTNGFLRATVRGLAQQRKREDMGAATPFRLVHWSDGRLTLEDPGTGRRVELEAFGQTNETAFAKLLPEPVLPLPPSLR